MGCSVPSFSKPSTVVISAPSACTASTVHDFTVAPFISTVHAPQSVVSHPTCVPVRSSPSRSISTKSVLASTAIAYGLPFTVRLIGTFSNTGSAGLFGARFLLVFIPVLGIKMSTLNLLAPGTTHGNADRALQQRSDQEPLVLRRAPHIGLWISRSACRVSRPVDVRVTHRLSAQRCFCLSRLDWSQSHAAQRDGYIGAGVTLDAELYRRARRWINRCCPLERDISAPTSFRRHFDENLAHQLVFRQHRRVCVRDELAQRHHALAIRPNAPDAGIERDEHGRPVAAGIGLGNRSADR